MADPAPSLAALHERLRDEYYALVKVVTEFDGRLVTVKGWSVTLSLAARLGTGLPGRPTLVLAEQTSAVDSQRHVCTDTTDGLDELRLHPAIP